MSLAQAAQAEPVEPVESAATDEATEPQQAAIPATAAPQPVVPRPSAVDLLEIFGIPSKQLQLATDGSTLSEAEYPLLLRTLEAISRFSLTDHAELAWRPFAFDTHQGAEYRGEMFALSGTLTEVTEAPLTAELLARFQAYGEPITRVYRCEVLLDAPEATADSDATTNSDETPQPAETTPTAAQRVTVYALRVPKAWKLNTPLQLRTSTTGIFFRCVAADSEPRPLFLAARMAWYPPTILGDLGMDYGLFDSVVNPTPLLHQDRDCLYSMLAAADRVTLVQLMRYAPQQSSILPLFKEPDKQQGQLVSFIGTARRAVLVRVEDPEVIANYGIDHYYQIDLTTMESDGNPLTFCVLRLPPGMPTGDDILTDIRVVGFFMKTWYHRRLANPNDPNEIPSQIYRQIQPLIIGREPFLFERVSNTETANYIAGGLFVTMLLGFCLGIWWLNRGDRRFHQQTIAPRYHAGAAISFDALASFDPENAASGEPSVTTGQGDPSHEVEDETS